VVSEFSSRANAAVRLSLFGGGAARRRSSRNLMIRSAPSLPRSMMPSPPIAVAGTVSGAGSGCCGVFTQVGAGGRLRVQ
jgi:hypothetical protein